jgi:anti-anti-sigma factor
VETAEHHDSYVVAPVGEIDRSTVGSLEIELKAAERSDARRIVLDLSGVTFLDSGGLKLLIHAQDRSRADSNRLRLVRGPRRVQRVFELTDTEALMPFLD